MVRQIGLVVLIALALTCMLMTGGCGITDAYVLEGKVIRGSYSTMAFVSPDDPRLQQSGIGNVQVSIFRDPSKPNREMVARDINLPDGTFSISISEFGAGWMVEEWQIKAGRPQFQTADLIIGLPKAKKNRRLLIMLTGGPSDLGQRDEDDLMELYERYK